MYTHENLFNQQKLKGLNNIREKWRQFAFVYIQFARKTNHFFNWLLFILNVTFSW